SCLPRQLLQIFSLVLDFGGLSGRLAPCNRRNRAQSKTPRRIQRKARSNLAPRAVRQGRRPQRMIKNRLQTAAVPPRLQAALRPVPLITPTQQLPVAAAPQVARRPILKVPPLVEKLEQEAIQRRSHIVVRPLRRKRQPTKPKPLQLERHLELKAAQTAKRQNLSP